jgi:hypothetical protein
VAESPTSSKADIQREIDLKRKSGIAGLLGLTWVIATGLFFGLADELSSPATSATAVVCVALLALFAFLADGDEAFGILTSVAKGLAAGVALPIAVLTSGLDMNATGFVVVLLLFAALAVLTFVLRRSADRSNGKDEADARNDDDQQSDGEPQSV